MNYVSRHEWQPPAPETFQADLAISTPLGRTVLNGLNTYLHTYDEADGAYDHVSVVQDFDHVAVLPLSDPNTRALAGALLSRNFPHYHDSFVADEIRAWFIGRSVRGQAEDN